MKKFILLVILLFLVGCSNEEEYDQQFMVIGKIQSINEQTKQIYIKGNGPINVDSIKDLQIGEKIKITLLAKNTDTCWCPDQWKVKQIEIIENN